MVRSVLKTDFSQGNSRWYGLLAVVCNRKQPAACNLFISLRCNGEKNSFQFQCYKRKEVLFAESFLSKWATRHLGKITNECELREETHSSVAKANIEGLNGFKVGNCISIGKEVLG